MSPTFWDFFSKEHNVFFNSPNHTRVEYWYLFYVNALAGIVAKNVINGGEAMALAAGAADTLAEIAEKVQYDFNAQGFDFTVYKSWTNKHIYRQPDSLAGFAYNMLFAALSFDKPDLIAKSAYALDLYAAFESNPWYEIPNGSSGLYAAAWLNAHGWLNNVKKTAAWIFDNQEGPLQVGKWGKEPIDGLIMGWRGDNRMYAASAAYSMETLMPLQFILPAIRYCPELCKAAAKYIRCALSSFRLFFAEGTELIYETKPNINVSVPYEKLERERDGHTPAACGDYYGHRSVYGAGYMYWVEALARKTGENMIPALDLSLTDWPSAKKYPIFLLDNPFDRDVSLAFTPAPAWKCVAPDLFADGRLEASVWDLEDVSRLGAADGAINCALGPGRTKLIAVLPNGNTPQRAGGVIKCSGAELMVE
jgi:hypothetical protein